MEEASLAELYRSLDLCFAVAAPETEPFLRFLWLRPEVRPRLQRFARVALPVVIRNSAQAITIPDGIVPEEGDAAAQAEALSHVRAVARAVVPTVAVYERAIAIPFNCNVQPRKTSADVITRGQCRAGVPQYVARIRMLT